MEMIRVFAREKGRRGGGVEGSRIVDHTRSPKAFSFVDYRARRDFN